MTELFKTFLTIFIPSGLLLYGMFLVVKSFLSKELNKNLLEIKNQNAQASLPLRLQAYERMSLYLERITPNNLVRRLMDNSYNVVQFQHLLITEVRAEFNHNLSQQIYMSDDAWEIIRSSTEEVVTLINSAAEGLEDEAPAMELGKKIFEFVIDNQYDQAQIALKFIKNEIRQVF